MYCPKCSSENESSAQFCKNCGWDLTKSITPTTNESYAYFGIMALMLPVMNILMKIHYKVFLLIYGEDNWSHLFGNIIYKITLSFLEIIWFSIPILIVIKTKNLSMRIIVIILTAILLVFELLAIFDIYNWYTFWNRP